MSWQWLRSGFGLLSAASLLAAACGEPPNSASGPEPTSPAGGGTSWLAPVLPGQLAEDTVHQYRLRAEPFSPTLGRIFSNGQLVVFPDYASLAGTTSSLAEDYAFSAIDGFARVYHFLKSPAWLMSGVTPLGEELPAGGWRADWNPSARALELLITAPYADATSTELYRLEDRVWKRVETESRPAADAAARAIFEPTSGAWFVVSSAGGPQGGFMRLDAGRWDQLTARPAPDFSRARRLAGVPGGLALLGDGGEVWLWMQGAWSHELTLAEPDPLVFHFDPRHDRILVANSAGIGRTSLQWLTLARGHSALGPPTRVSQSDVVSINGEVQGVWSAVGQLAEEEDATGQRRSVFLPGELQGDAPALALESRAGVTYWRPAEIEQLDIQPQFDSLMPDRGGFVPTLLRHVEVSANPSGMETIPEAVFPYLHAEESSDAEPARVAARSTLRFHHSRFWAFQGTNVEWLKPYPEIHGDLQYRSVRFNAQTGLRERLAWGFPGPGVFQFRYQREDGKNLQWTRSPALGLRQIPGIDWKPGGRFWLLDPVAWGERPTVALAGWVGQLEQEIRLEDPSGRPVGVAYRRVPETGLFARISALTPKEWVAAPLPVPFGLGCRLVSNPGDEELYLLGGRIARRRTIQRQTVFRMERNEDVWRWNGGQWARLRLSGRAPRLEGEWAVVYDPFRRRLLVLNEEGLFSLQKARWSRLWDASAQPDAPPPGRPALYVHPNTGQILGGWTGEPARLAVWSVDRWIPIVAPAGSTPIGLALRDPEDLLPAPEGEAWLIADAEHLNALRNEAYPDPEIYAETYGLGMTLEPILESSAEGDRADEEALAERARETSIR